MSSHFKEIVPLDPSLVVNPATGEVIELAGASDVELGQILAGIKHFRAQISSLKSRIDAELVGRMDHHAKYTINLPGLRLTAPSPGVVEYDPKALLPVLERAVEESVISEGAASEALEQVITYKPRKAGIAALLKGRDLSPARAALAEAIEGCKAQATRPRTVTVKEL